MAKRMHLTDAKVAQLPAAKTGQYIVRDTTPGYFVVVGKKRRTWTIQAALGGKDRRWVIGHADTLPAAEARQKAVRWLAEVQAGRDPTQVGEAARAATLLDVARLWFADLERRRRSPKTIGQYRDVIERLLARHHATPLSTLGDQPEIMAAEFDRVTRDHGPYMANATGRTIRALYRWAQGRDRSLPPYNATSAIRYNPEERRQRGMAPEDLAEWWSAVNKLSPVRREMHLFALLSALRKTDLTTMEWSQVDLEARTLFVPRPKSGRPFHLPLSQPMLDCLQRAAEAGRVLDEVASRRWCWVSPTSASGHAQEVKERTVAVTGHALRATWIGLATIADVNHQIIKLLVNHSTAGDVTSGYLTRSALSAKLADAQDRVSALIMEALPPH